MWNNYQALASIRESSFACIRGRAATHDVTEEEEWLAKSIGVGTVAASLRTRGRGDFFRVTLLLRRGTSYRPTENCIQRQKNALILLGAGSKTASYICRGRCFASLARNGRH